MATVSEVLKALHKAHGPRIGGRAYRLPKITRIPTGIFGFDFAVGGGFPRGGLTILSGTESSGKTNLALLGVAYAQRLHPKEHCVYVDLEATVSQSWAETLGVDWSKLVYVRPEYGEQAVDIVDSFLRASDVSMVVVDSVSMIAPHRELENIAEEQMVGGSSRLVGLMSRKNGNALSEAGKYRTPPALVYISQIRYKIGVIHGDPEVLPGGASMKFFPTLIVRLYGKNEMDKKVHPTLPIWKDTKGTIKKNKTPIVSTTLEYKMALYAHDGLRVGQADDFRVMAAYMKEAAILVKDGSKGWKCNGVSYPTLDVLRKAVNEDLKLRRSLMQLLSFRYFDNKHNFPEEEEPAVEIVEETTEETDE